MCFHLLESELMFTLNILVYYSITHFYSYDPIDSDTIQSSCLFRSYCCESFFLFFQTFRSFTRHGCARTHQGIGLLTKVRPTEYPWLHQLSVESPLSCNQNKLFQKILEAFWRFSYNKWLDYELSNITWEEITGLNKWCVYRLYRI